VSLPPLGPELLVHSTFDDTAVRRAHSRGTLVRLAPGRYVRSDVWLPLDPVDREILRIIAVVSCLRTPVVVSHSSAASLWRLPRLGSATSRVHVIDRSLDSATGGTFVVRHATALAPTEVVSVHGTSVTTPVRTAVDLALTATRRHAVTALDHGLRTGLFTPADLAAGLQAHPAIQRRRKAQRALDFADGRANRPGESLSRVVMAEHGLEAPELQRPFRRDNGERAEVDFWWPSVGVVGEFDGEVKYRDNGMRGGRSIEQVVIDEKNRENWLRALPEVRGFARWTWRDVTTPGRLARILTDAGVPAARPSTS
jgi:hypothetical protein